MYKMKTKKNVSVKQIYIWNILGSIANALTSMILLMLVTRTSDSLHADMFSIGFALAQQFVTIGIFQVRNYQATDVQEKFRFRDYFFFRVLTCCVMMAVSFGYIVLKGYSQEKGIIVFLLCLSKVVEALSDVYQGFFQQKERLDLAGKTLVLRSCVNCTVFGFTLFIWKDMMLSVICMLVSSFLCFWFYERSRYRKFPKIIQDSYSVREFLRKSKEIFLQCFPLFINGFLIMSIYNAPKNAIDSLCGQQSQLSGMQTDYNILFMPASVINLFLIFLRPYMTHMAYAWTSGQKSRFRKLILQMTLGISIFSLFTIIGAWILGIPILELVYGKNLSMYRRELLVLILGGMFSSLATVFDNIITVIRYQHFLVISYIISWATALIISGPMVERLQITGAALVFLLTMVILAGVNVGILFIGLIRKKRN